MPRVKLRLRASLEIEIAAEVSNFDAHENRTHELPRSACAPIEREQIESIVKLNVECFSLLDSIFFSERLPPDGEFLGYGPRRRVRRDSAPQIEVQVLIESLEENRSSEGEVDDGDKENEQLPVVDVLVSRLSFASIPNDVPRQHADLSRGKTSNVALTLMHV